MIVYFSCDVLARCLAYGTLAGAILCNDDIPGRLAVVPFIVLYVNRGVLMSCMYMSRGFIYPPEAPATEDGTTASQKMIFGFVLAGFVQTITDFPFNGDLATNKK